MEVHEVKELMEQFDKSTLQTLELVFHDTTIKMSKADLGYGRATGSNAGATSSVITPPPPPVKLNLIGNSAVTAPVTGLFYMAPLGADSTQLKVGDTVAPGDILCFIDSMNIMTQVKAPCAGVIKGITVSNEALVEAGDLLILLGE